MGVESSLTPEVLSCGPALLDVSHWQARLDPAAIRAAGIVGVYHKATQGQRYKAKRGRSFSERAPLLVNGGLHVSGYHYTKMGATKTRPKPNLQSAAPEARYFCAALASVPGAVLPAMLDFEEAKLITKLGPRAAAEWINWFAAEFREHRPAGVPERLLIYSYPAAWRRVDAAAIDWDHCDLWMARYLGRSEETTRLGMVKRGGEYAAIGGRHALRPANPTPVMWQWTSHGRCPGVSGRCDINVADREWWKATTEPAAAPPNASAAAAGKALSVPSSDRVDHVPAKPRVKERDPTTGRFKKAEGELPYWAEAQRELRKLKITDGSHPHEPATRAQVWTMLYRTIKIIKKLVDPPPVRRRPGPPPKA